MKDIKGIMEKLRPLHKKLESPRTGDWLSSHHEEGQSFDQYRLSKPLIPDSKRRVIYIQPIGEYTGTQQKIIALTADFSGRYYNLPVKISADLPLSAIPPGARRVHPSWGDKQILTTYVLENVLKPGLPSDAFANLGLTTSDLWPGEGWNFVFGQASLSERVGVWSIYRNGDPEESEKSYRLCLLRTLKTAVHELGHMFSMHHCTAYECCMCGSNNREESDRRPLHLCPECMAKVCWATGSDPLKRYKKLEAFCRKNRLTDEEKFYLKSISVLEAK